MIPNFLVDKLLDEYGKELTDKIIEGYSKNRPTTFRVNTIKASKEKIIANLIENDINFEEYKILENGFIIRDENIKIEELDIYKNGEIYVQNFSSMLPPIILEPQKKYDILDMAAAPGGKTTQIAALTSNNAHITACEMNNIRAERLKYNIEKQGASSVYVMQTDSRKIDNMFSFDQILLDAPCSGSGTLNKDDEKLEKYFTEQLIKKSIKSQTALLRKALRILKPNHQMIYSTCSVLKEENEQVLQEVLKNYNAEIIPIKLKNEEEFPILPTNIQGTLCLYPNELFEGFFIAKILKR